MPFPIPSRRERRAWSAKHPVLASALFSMIFSACIFLVLPGRPLVAMGALLIASFGVCYLGIRRFA